MHCITSVNNFYISRCCQMAKCLKTAFLQTASRCQHVSCVHVHIHILVSWSRIRRETTTWCRCSDVTGGNSWRCDDGSEREDLLHFILSLTREYHSCPGVIVQRHSESQSGLTVLISCSWTVFFQTAPPTAACSVAGFSLKRAMTSQKSNSRLRCCVQKT